MWTRLFIFKTSAVLEWNTLSEEFYKKGGDINMTRRLRPDCNTVFTAQYYKFNNFFNFFMPIYYRSKYINVSKKESFSLSICHFIHYFIPWYSIIIIMIIIIIIFIESLFKVAWSSLCFFISSWLFCRWTLQLRVHEHLLPCRVYQHGNVFINITTLFSDYNLPVRS